MEENNNGQQSPNGDVGGEFEKFSSNFLQGQGEAPSPLPEEIGGIETAKLNEALSEFTGGAIGNISDVKSYLTQIEELKGVQNQYRELKLREKEFLGGPKYSDAIIQQMDKMRADGSTLEDIQKYLALQNLDFDKMSAKDLIRQKMSHEFKDLSNAEIDALIEEKFGEESEDDDPLYSAKLKAEKREAIKYLEGLKVDLEEPEHIRQKKIAQEKVQNTLRNWGAVLSPYYENKETMSISVTLGEGKDFSYDFNVPKEARQALGAQLAEYATNNNIEPNEKGYELIQAQAQRMMYFLYGPQILENALRSVSSKTKEETLQGQHNVNDLERGAPNPSTGGGSDDPLKALKNL